jgi:hypothetical protein
MSMALPLLRLEQLANASADACVAACGDAAALSEAAREAAPCCALARDDAADAALVARLATIRNLRDRDIVGNRQWRRDVAPDNVAREFADGHEKERSDAVAASFAAREAGVRCAAASRRAVSAASIARKIASRCEGAGGDGVAAEGRSQKKWSPVSKQKYSNSQLIVTIIYIVQNDVNKIKFPLYHNKSNSIYKSGYLYFS